MVHKLFPLVLAAAVGGIVRLFGFGEVFCHQLQLAFCCHGSTFYLVTLPPMAGPWPPSPLDFGLKFGGSKSDETPSPLVFGLVWPEPGVTQPVILENQFCRSSIWIWRPRRTRIKLFWQSPTKSNWWVIFSDFKSIVQHVWLSIL